MGAIGPIPWDSIDRYATKNGFATTDIEYDSFVYIIQFLDSTFMEHQAEQIKRNSPKGGMQGGKAGGIRSPNPGPRGRRAKRGR